MKTILSLLLTLVASVALAGQPVTEAGPRMFYEQSEDPTTLADTAIGYGKEVAGVTEFFVKDSYGSVTQITSGGSVVGGSYADDTPANFGTSLDAKLLWETADANANEFILTMPEGGSTNVPVFVVGDTTLLNKDLGLFNGQTSPTIAVVDGGATKSLYMQHNGTDAVIKSSSGDIVFDGSTKDTTIKDTGRLVVGDDVLVANKPALSIVMPVGGFGGSYKNVMLMGGYQSDTTNLYNNTNFGMAQLTNTANNYAFYTTYNANWVDVANFGTKITGHGTLGTNSGEFFIATANGALPIQHLTVSKEGYVALGETVDTDGTPAVGKLIVKATTSDGTTNAIVARDSSEENRFVVDSNGSTTITSDSTSGYALSVVDNRASGYSNILSFLAPLAPSGTVMTFGTDATHNSSWTWDASLNKMAYQTYGNAYPFEFQGSWAYFASSAAGGSAWYDKPPAIGGVEYARFDNTNKVLAINTTDLDGTPAIGKLVVKGTTADGTTNVFVGRDSSENNVFYVNTDGGVSLTSMLTNWTNTGRTVADLGSITTADLNGGTIDSMAIGSSTPSTGAFTTLSHNGSFSTTNTKTAEVLGSDILTDGALEIWTDANNLTNWTTTDVIGTNGTLDREGTITHGGSYAAKFTNVGGHAKAILQQHTLSVGDSYRIKFWARGASGGEASTLIFYDNCSVPTQYWDFSTNAWVAYSFPPSLETTVLTNAYAQQTVSDDITVPAAGTVCVILMGDGGTPGNVTYIDDATMQKVTAGVVANLFDLQSTQDPSTYTSSDSVFKIRNTGGSGKTWAQITGDGLLTVDDVKTGSIKSEASANIDVIMADTNGTYKVSLKDSTSTERMWIDSKGNIYSPFNYDMLIGTQSAGTADADGKDVVVFAGEGGSGGTGNHAGGDINLDVGAPQGSGTYGKVNIQHTSTPFGYLWSDTGGRLLIAGSLADSATSVGLILGADANYTTTGAKVISFRDNIGTAGGTELSFIDLEGDFMFPMYQDGTVGVVDGNASSDTEGGSLIFLSGKPGSQTTGSDGGDITLHTADAAGAGNNNGGDIVLDLGLKSASGSDGIINLAVNSSSFAYISKHPTVVTPIFSGNVANSASATAIMMGAYNNLSTAGAKLFSVYNNISGGPNSSEKFYINQNGDVSIVALGTGTNDDGYDSASLKLNGNYYNASNAFIGEGLYDLRFDHKLNLTAVAGIGAGTEFGKWASYDLDFYYYNANQGTATKTVMSVSGEGTLTTTGGRIVNVTNVNAATYDLVTSDYFLSVSYTTTGAVTSLTLPTAQCVDGRTIVIKDPWNNAASNNITIDTEGSEKIDLADTYVMNVNGQSINLTCYSSNWYVH